MPENKTRQTDASFASFLNTVENESTRKDCFVIAQMMQNISNCEPKMWGESIVGFGSYHYKYETGREGDICKIGFSPRKKNIAFYIMKGINDHPELLERLGKHTTGKGCLYINKLSDIDEDILKKLIKSSFEA